jgi:hypothetical protein
MTSRILPRSEWSKVADKFIDLDKVSGHAHMTILVEEDGQDVVGCWAFAMVAHADGLWIREDHRKKGVVLRRLWRAMKDVAHAHFVTHVLSFVKSDEMTDLMESMKASKVPTEYLLSLERRA